MNMWSHLTGVTIAGGLGGSLLVALLLVTNTLGLRDLVAADRAPLIAGGLLALGCVSLFAAGALAWGVWRLAEEGDR